MHLWCLRIFFFFWTLTQNEEREKKKSTVILLSLHYLSFSIDPLHCWVIEKENCRLPYTSVVSSFILFSFIYRPPPPPHTLANWQNGRSDGIFHDPERSFTANKHSLGWDRRRRVLDIQQLAAKCLLFPLSTLLGVFFFSPFITHSLRGILT